MSVAHCDASSWCLSRSLMGKNGVLDCLSRSVMVAYQTAYYALSYYGTISVTDINLYLTFQHQIINKIQREILSILYNFLFFQIQIFIFNQIHFIFFILNIRQKQTILSIQFIFYHRLSSNQIKLNHFHFHFQQIKIFTQKLFSTFSTFDLFRNHFLFRINLSHFFQIIESTKIFLTSSSFISSKLNLFLLLLYKKLFFQIFIQQIYVEFTSNFCIRRFPYSTT
jgi:hypothetical protein